MSDGFVAGAYHHRFGLVRRLRGIDPMAVAEEEQKVGARREYREYDEEDASEHFVSSVRLGVTVDGEILCACKLR